MRLAALCLCICAVPLAAETPSDWARQKCTLYRAILSDAFALQGSDGLSQSFLRANDTFLANGCQGPRTLCPVSPQERDFADLLTVMTMNEGMASTFVPFGCPD